MDNKVVNARHYCLKCKSRADELADRLGDSNRNFWFFVYLKRHLELDEVEPNNPRECGCHRPLVDLDLVENKILIDVTSTWGFKRLSGIQNYVFSIIQNIDFENDPVELVIESPYGYSLISKQEFLKSLELKTKDLQVDIRRLGIFNQIIHFKFYKRLKTLLIRFESIPKIYKIIAKILFRRHKSFNSPLKMKDLIVTNSCVLWAPDSILDFNRLSIIRTYRENPKTKFALSIHDLFLIIYPQLFSHASYSASHVLNYQIEMADVISVQSKTVEDSVRSYLDISKAYSDSTTDIPELYVHPRPLNSDSDFNAEPIRSDNDYDNDISKIRNSKSKVRILWLSTIEPRKNLDLVLSAIELLHSEFQDYIFTIVGFEGWKSSETLKRISFLQQAGLPINVFLNVNENQKKLIMDASDIFIYSSISEGIGLPLFDFLRTNRIVLSSNLSVIKEFIFKADNLFIFKQNPVELCSKLLQIIHSKLYNEKFATPVMYSISWRESVANVIRDFKSLIQS